VPWRDAVRHTTEGDHAQLWFGLEDCGWYIFEVPAFNTNHIQTGNHQLFTTKH
jgi:hypothetical protein